MPIDDGTTRNLLTHYRQVSLDNVRAHTATYINMPTRDAQDNDMFYYFLLDLLTNEFCMTILLYADIYTVNNVPIRADNAASTMHIREMLIESKLKLLILKGNIYRIQPVGVQADGTITCMGARSSQPAVLPLEGI